MWTARTSLVPRASLWGIGANRLRPGSPVANTTPPAALREAMAGVTPRLTAGDYAGGARQWERVCQANRDQVQNPDRIERGTRLRIPGAVLPDETNTECLSLARRIVTPPSGSAGPKVGRPPEGEVQTPGETPSASASPRMEPAIPPGPGRPTDRPARSGASIRSSAKRR